MDIIITKIKAKFLTSVYRKPSFTRQYFHFQSFCTKKRKINLIKILYHRACIICSPELLHTETEKIKEILVGNIYPSELIKRVIKSHDDNRRKPKLFGPENFPTVLKLPYLSNVSSLFEKKEQEQTQSNYNFITFFFLLSFF